MVGLIAPKTLVTVIERQGLVNMEPAYMNVITNIPCVEVEDYVDFDDRIRRPHLAYIDNPMAVTTFWIQWDYGASRSLPCGSLWSGMIAGSRNTAKFLWVPNPQKLSALLGKEVKCSFSANAAVVLQQMGILGAFVILLVIVWRFRRRRHHIKLQTNTEA
ncbi:hypothetical protein AAVH_23449, partial [Aphelenchoides avenae]